MTAPVPADGVITTEFCFRDLCDSIELAPDEDHVELFGEIEAPYTWVARSGDRLQVQIIFNVGPPVTAGMDGDVIMLRVMDAEGSVIVDETRAVDYAPRGGDAACGSCYYADVDVGG